MAEKIIMYDDPSIIRKVDMMDETGKVISVGYLSNDNYFYNDANMARYRSCTHKTCECGKPMTKYYTKCESCRNKINNQRYNELPFQEWDGVTPIAIYDDDVFFFDIDDLEWYCEQNEITPDELRLVICEPNKMREIPYDYWDDIMPENMEELPKEINDALEAFNKVIREAKPISWRPGKIRTTYYSNEN